MFKLLVLLTFFCPGFGQNLPEFTIDRTADLFGLTVYVEYVYYKGYWMVPWNYLLPHYSGVINDIPEDGVFDPYEKAQMRGEY